MNVGVAGLTIALGLLGSGCAATQDDTPTSPMQLAAVEDEVRTPMQRGMVCRNEAPVGTHIVRRRCYTRAEITTMSNDSRDWLRSRGTKGAVHRPKDSADPRDGG